MSIRANTAIIAPIVLFLIGVGATIWLVTTPWLMRRDHAIEASDQAAPELVVQIGVKPNDQ